MSDESTPYAMRLTAVEAQRLVDFLTARLAVPSGSHGDRFCFTVIHAGIGTCTRVLDREDRVEQDITDFEAW